MLQRVQSNVFESVMRVSNFCAELTQVFRILKQVVCNARECCGSGLDDWLARKISAAH